MSIDYHKSEIKTTESCKNLALSVDNSLKARYT
nr:MAG TPA: hypothetical protein [Caudoviricetes sp.]